ncbi:MAG TPA: N,N-dimethylformamidase beta subunit family domain-containing protein [Pararobbsia sp.]|nr:N,N-dimethylformamidase beta subunit family domain-containing protein [Pararobbsia sp.]
MLKITGYADRISAHPGETIRLMVNCEYPTFELDVVRVVQGDTSPAAPRQKLQPVEGSRRTLPGLAQRIIAGSFGIVDNVPTLSNGQPIGFQAYVFPTTPRKGSQTLISHYDPDTQSGLVLGIDSAGAAFFELIRAGSHYRASASYALTDHAWFFVGGSWNPQTSELTVVQIPLQAIPTIETRDTVRVACDATPGSLSPATPLTFAARWQGFDRQREVGSDYFNGKIDRPRVVRAALPVDDMLALQRDDLDEGTWPQLVGAWDFAAQMQTDRFADTSGHCRDGRLVNMPTRAVTGHNFSGEVMCWTQRPSEWSAVHFHDDDLYDARWETSFDYPVPADLRSGIYAFRLASGNEEQFVTFVVRPPQGKATARLLYLFPLATYMAYANEHFGTDDGLVELHLNRALVLHPHQVFLNEHREYGHSLYDLHSDGSGVYYSSRLRPILNMRPKVESNHGARPSNLWLMNADTHITDWLEHLDVDYDVVTDEDLHIDGPELLARYSAVVTATHPEYYSKRMWDSLYTYTRNGGRLMYLGGNGFYWRIAFNESLPGIIETRRAEGGSRAWEPPTGEYYHAFTGEYGGMWRRQGDYAPNRLVGVGFAAQGFDRSSPYQRGPDSYDPRVAFAFEGIEETVLGDFGLIGGGAAGMEVDRYDASLGSPRNALILASSGKQTEAHVLVLEDMLFNFMGTTGNIHTDVRSDMVFFESGHGGAVFSTGSIAYCGALSHNGYDNAIARLTRNVLHRFLDSTPFAD